MHEQEEVDGDTGDAVQDPGPHAFLAAIQRASETGGLDGRCTGIASAEGTRRLRCHERPLLTQFEAVLGGPRTVVADAHILSKSQAGLTTH